MPNKLFWFIGLSFVYIQTFRQKNSMKQISIVLFALFLLTFSTLNAQEIEPCGTGNYRSEWLDDYQQNPTLYRTVTEDTLFLPLKIHVVGTDDGGGFYPARSILESLCKLNEDFEPTGIQFYVEGEWNYLMNDNWYDHNFSQGGQMMSINNVPNAINCYIVLSPAGNCGYYSPSRDGIALNKGCLGAYSSTWAHEIGHFLSLPHTFVGWEGQDDFDFSESAPFFMGGRQVERVDGSNCGQAADGFCDTPPDYLSFRWTCSQVDSSMVLQTDPNGEKFRSDGTFIMSYSNDACASRFSEEQIDAMRANITFQRPNLLTNVTVQNDITDYEAEIVSPLLAETVTNFNAVTLEWEPVPNATHYVVHVNPIPVFSALFDEYVVSDNSLTLTNLEAERTYFWRIRPYNAFSTCTEYLDTSSFVTGQLSDLTELEAATDLEVYPNPAKVGQNWQVDFQLSARTPVTINLYTIDGRLLYREAYDLGSGRQQLRLPTSDLSGGLYLLEVRLPKGSLHKKLSVLR